MGGVDPGLTRLNRDLQRSSVPASASVVGEARLVAREWKDRSPGGLLHKDPTPGGAAQWEKDPAPADKVEKWPLLPVILGEG